MAEITCTRCDSSGDQLPTPPLPGEVGAKIRAEICTKCWREWLEHQKALINHYSLNLLEPEAKKFLTEQTKIYLFGEAAEQP